MSERLWAPWRLAYIEEPKSGSECIFCDAPKPERDDEALILHRAEFAYVILNRYPYVSGHLMVAPYKHSDTLQDFSDDELLQIQKLLQMSILSLQEEFNPQGYNLGVNLGKVAGAGVEGHLHWHIVPRWAGDTNYMPVIANIHVIPDSLKSTLQRLRARWEQNHGKPSFR